MPSIGLSFWTKDYNSNECAVLVTRVF